ncbi:MAG: monovalent cation/H+ antiporter complex subunit F [Thermoflexales bacterium]|nr:monovalent cation/H+ antiporter complex subunit F [Thermoflexales bacterium]MDW8350832.1 monovalent cation/H+ antiporter complex subunit F [Anaerolineae bacterium]
MEQILSVTFALALFVHAVLLSVAVWRTLRGENAVDRLLSVELLSMLALCMLILITLITGESIYMDIALALAALGFIGTLALAKYLADQRMF